MGVEKTLKACRKANMSSTACITVLIVPTELFQNNCTLSVIVVVQEKKHPLLKMSVTMMRNYLCMTHSLMTSCKKHKMTTQYALVVLPVKTISKMIIVSMISLRTKKCMTGYITAKQLMGICVKSARFSMGNHQCQHKESQRGNISWKCRKEVTTPYKIETSHRCHSGNNFHQN